MAYSFRYSRFVYFLAQVGSRAKRNQSRSMLLEQSDLPGNGWRLKGELAWRTGAFGRSSEIWRRARSEGSFTVVRHYEQLAAEKWLMIRVAPTASIQDAIDVVPIQLSLSMPNPKVTVEVTSEGLVTDAPMSDISHPWVYERLTEGSPEGPTSSRFVSFHVDHVAILMEFPGLRDAWSWDEIAEIAGKQAASVWSHLLSGSPTTGPGDQLI